MWELFQLVKITGWTPAQIEAAPATFCDWLVRFNGLHARLESKAARESNA